MSGTEKPERKPTGPEPERLKIEGFDDWTDAVREGLKKPPLPRRQAAKKAKPAKKKGRPAK